LALIPLPDELARAEFAMFVNELLTRLRTLTGGTTEAVAPSEGPEQPDTIDRSQLTIFFERDPLVELYEDSMRSTQAPADSFYKRCRFFALAQLCEIALSRYAEGDIVECGCWRGHSAHMIGVLATKHAFKGLFHIFDSFEGLSGLTQEDKSERHERW
jgi:hypothetical protein